MKYDLEERLIRFASSVINFTQSVRNTMAGQHLTGQIIRSGTAPALLYGEAQAAESRKDFVHKMKIALKELRETSICLRIIDHQKLYIKDDLPLLLRENTELIAIFSKSITTASNNLSNDTKHK